MKDIIVDLKLSQETKDFLYNTKIKKNEFESINIKFFSKEQEDEEELDLLFEKAKKDLILIDNKVAINDNECNRGFWNGILESYKEWCLD